MVSHFDICDADEAHKEFFRSLLGLPKGGLVRNKAGIPIGDRGVLLDRHAWRYHVEFHTGSGDELSTRQGGPMNMGMVFALSVALAGCTTAVTSSSANHVIVESYQMNRSKAQELADVECAKHHRNARLTLEPTLEDTRRKEARSYIFACID